MNQQTNQLRSLASQGASLLSTAKYPPPDLCDDFTPKFVDSSQLNVWRTRVLTFIRTLNLPNDFYSEELNKILNNSTSGSVKSAVDLINALADDIDNELFQLPSPASVLPLNHLERIFDRFDKIARQLNKRHANRSTLEITDEYDVQDLLHAILCLYFDDIRPEEWNPSYAGKSTRSDFLLKKESIVIEVKKTRDGLGAKELGKQLIEDIAHYKGHNDCDVLVAFVYDPESHVDNPRGIEADLSEQDGEIPINVFIRPK